MGLTGPRRAYLLVTHSDASGTRVDVGNDTILFGEAISWISCTGLPGAIRL